MYKLFGFINHYTIYINFLRKRRRIRWNLHFSELAIKGNSDTWSYAIINNITEWLYCIMLHAVQWRGWFSCHNPTKKDILVTIQSWPYYLEWCYYQYRHHHHHHHQYIGEIRGGHYTKMAYDELYPIFYACSQICLFIFYFFMPVVKCV